VNANFPALEGQMSIFGHRLDFIFSFKFFFALRSEFYLCLETSGSNLIEYMHVRVNMSSLLNTIKMCFIIRTFYISIL
jgi:hypothetical protein